jgi:iron complex outermembrane receptor protein
MDFNVGGYEQKELNVNADFSYALSDSLNLGFGAEWREETYTAIAGEPNSFFGFGASGLKGVTSDDAVANARDNVAVYADLEHDVSDAVLLQYAVRYESFSDFGDTVNGKIAGRFRLSDAFALRGAVSTGFHAPTPGQSNVRTTITTADSVTGLLVIEGLLPPTDPAAVAVGGTALTEESSINYSVGFTSNIGDNTTLTIDFYLIEVDDRIYRTGNIPDTVSGGTISFYTNALDVEHSGVDIVLTSGWDWGANASTDLTLAASYNEVDVVGQNAVQVPVFFENPAGSGNFDLSGFRSEIPVSDSNVEDIENNYPNERAVLTLNNHFGENFDFMLRANYYGKHHDERGDLGVDKFELGATVFVDKVGPPFSNRLSAGLENPRRSAANYEGDS